MSTDYGVCLTNYGDVTSPEASIGTAALAEQLGFDSVWVSDHILVPPTFGAEFGDAFLDPFVCLSFAAAETKNVLLGTTVVVVPLRSPFAQAKMLSTLDYLSGGRVVFGIGAGWDREEFDALGIEFRDRGSMTDEYLDIMKTLWAPGVPRFEGRFHQFDGAAFEPKPLQSNLPIWVGGYGKAAINRTLRVGDAWHPSEMPPGEVAALYDDLRARAAGYVPKLTYRMYLRPSDISPAPMRSPQAAFEGDKQALIEYIESYTHALPLTHLVFELVVSSADDLKSGIRHLAEDVLPNVRGSAL